MVKKNNENATTALAERRVKRKGSMLGVFAVAIVLVTVAVAAGLINWGIDLKKDSMLESVQKREKMCAGSRIQGISIWLEDLTRQGDRLINSEMFRLYASEVDLLQGDVPLMLSEPGREMLEKQGGDDDQAFMLAAQLPMMRRLLEEFVSYSGFFSGRIINRKGQTYIATDANVASMTVEQSEAAQKVFENGEASYLPLRNSSTGLVMDIFLPIFKTVESSDKQTVAVLQLSHPASYKITELLSASPLVDQEYTTRLIQVNGGKFEEILPWQSEGLVEVPETASLPTAQGLEFGEHVSVDGKTWVYSHAVKVPLLDWWLIVEIDRQTAERELSTYRNTIIGMGAVCTLALILLFSLLWWWLVGRENKKVAGEFRNLAAHIEEQKIFLDNINSTIPEFVGVRDMADGKYVFVNQAFADAVGRSPEDMVGLDDAAIFGFDTAKRLANSDEPVLKKGEPVTVDETIYLHSSKYHFQISKVPFMRSGQDVRGILSVFRDNTAMIEAQERSRQVVEQTINALVRTIEEIDPYLGGHTRLMGAFSVELAKRLHMDDLEVTTVSAAANLSQIGKMFIDRQILNKPGKLTPEEVKAMQGHVEHARSILEEIEFNLPVVDAICQMNENVDGSGYPLGIKDEEIILPAKILAVTNGFCALIRPRSYRPAKPVDEALEMLEDSRNQYSASVVEVFREIVHSPFGDKLLAEIRAIGSE